MNNKVAVFIDNSNVFHNIKSLKKTDPDWVSFYNPLILAQKLSGNRKLIFVGFYCVNPPVYLLSESERGKKIYSTTKKYYSAIEKMDLVEVKYGNLIGTKGNLQEKNLDTQIATEMVTMAALGKYDTAIIVSNDGDYLSTAKNIHIFKKRVEVAFFKGSLSMALKKASDLVRRLRKSYFQKMDF